MDIKVLKNFDVSYADLINKCLVLVVSENEEKKTGGFTSQQLFLLNPETSEMAQVAPEFEKYKTEDISYATQNRDYLVFSTLHGEEGEAPVITWYIYKCYEGSLKQLHSMSMQPDTPDKKEQIKLFVLDEFHMLIQTETTVFTEGEDEPEITFFLKMYNAESGVVSEVTIPRLKETGISSMIPLSDSKCALKLGRSFLPDKPFAYKPPGFNEELIGTVPVNKLISELSIDMDNHFVETIEESKELTTLPYMKISGDLIIYAVYYPSEEKEDIIIYDTETGNKTVRINSRLSSINDLWHTFVIGETPYLISASGGGSARITNLNTQKVVSKLNAGDDIPAVLGDYVVVSRKKRKLLKDIDYVEVYESKKFLKEALYSAKASFEYAVVQGDIMILFIKDNKIEEE